MRKRIMCAAVAWLLCLSVLFGVPLDSAALEVTKDALARQISAAPAVETWADYLDTTALQAALEEAEKCLSDTTGAYTQQQTDALTQQLQQAVAALKKHTLSLSLDKKTAELDVGQTGTLALTVTPADAADAVEWSSSSTGVVITKSDRTGCEYKVLSHITQPVTLTAVSNGKTASCKVTTLNPLSYITVNIVPSVVYKTRSVQAVVTAYGTDGQKESTDDVVWEWSSSDNGIATVDSQGIVTGMSVGKCMISVRGISGGTVKTAQSELTVAEFIPVTELTPTNKATATAMTLTENEEVTYKVHVSDAATLKDLTWKTSDDKVLQVSSPSVTGSVAAAKVKAVGVGTATLSYKTTDGSDLSGKVKVTVYPMIDKLTLGESVLVLNPKRAKKLAVTVTPQNAGNQLLEWTSSDTKVCTVDFNGNITAVGVGVCNVTAQTTDGSDIEVVCRVRVANPSAQITLSSRSVSLNTGKTATLSATVTTVNGEKYTSKDEVNWKSTDTSVATVSASGKITAKKAGTATVTAYAKDSTDIRANCTVTVTTPVTGVKLNYSTLKLAAGSAKTLRPTVIPSYANNQAVSWKSSNKAAATVSSTGKVTAKAPGKTTITCTTSDGGYQAKCVVTVITPVTSLKLSATSVKLYTGKTKTLSVTVSPSNASDKTVNFTSSNVKVAKIDAKGVIKALKAGTAVITAVSADGACRAQCAVTVLQSVTGISVPDEMRCYAGQVSPLGASVLPSDASNKKLLYTSSNTAVATVTADGYVTAKKVGSSAVTVKSEDGGFTRTCLVSVSKKVKVTAFNFTLSSKQLKTGEKFTIPTQFSPVDASEKAVNFKSSNASVATVNSSGKVTAKGPGTCTVTGITVDGGYVDSCKITVKQPVKGISFKNPDCDIAVGRTVVLVPEFSPLNATNKKLTWKTDNKKIATVNADGKVKGIATGTCNITCTTEDGGYEATCNIMVYRALTGIAIGSKKAELAKGKQMTITVKFTPADATNKELIWTSSKPSVASVSSTGKVTAKNAGTAVISCKSGEGGFRAQCTVTVFRPASSVKLNYSSLRMDAGKTKTLKATVSPSSATYKTVKWRSSDTTVATIDENGKLTAVGAGSTRISAVSKDGYCSAYCAVTVVQPPKSVSLSVKSTKLDVGCAVQIKATVKPSTAYDKSVIWSSSDTKVATVSDIGVVTAKKAGKVTITCRTKAGSVKAEKVIQCKIPPESIKLSRGSMTLSPGKTSTLKAIFTPSDTTIQKVKWTSSNPSVVKVTSAGKVKALTVGSATVTAKSSDGGLKATCFITVPKRATGIKLNKSAVILEISKKTTLKATLIPSDATYDGVRWASSNTSVASVSSSGKVTAKKAGSATITATAEDGGFKKSCKVTVITPPASLRLNKSKATVNVKSTLTLKATVSPSDTTDKSVTFTSSDTAVATVSASGKVTAKKAGTAVITAVSSKKTVKAQCTVTVIIPVSSVKLSATAKTLYIGQSFTGKATVSPSNATDKSVKWSSSDSSVAKVTSSGKVTALAAGQAVITCKTVSGSKKAVCTVTVKKAVEQLSVSVTEKRVDIGDSFALKAQLLPADASEKGITYTSSDTSVATVSTAGKVTAKARGTAVITAKAKDNGMSASCTVTVMQPVTQIKLSESSVSTTQAIRFTLTAQVLPLDADDRSVQWASSDETVLTVTQNGEVEAVGKGEATVFCTDSTGKISASCTVTVGEPIASSILLSESACSLFIGEVIQLTADVYPLVCAQDVTYVSGDESVAYVSDKGTVTAMGEGKTVIRVQSADGYAAATCIIEVTA